MTEKNNLVINQTKIVDYDNFSLKQLLDMPLGELVINNPPTLEVRRVPGGWIYTTYHGLTFIPEPRA